MKSPVNMLVTASSYFSIQKKKKLHFLTSEWINIQVDYLAGLSFDWIIISLD